MDVTLFDAVNFGGRSATLGVGSYPLTGPSAPLDKVASIQVPAGMVALVYELADNAGGYGRSADLMENYADVSTLGLAGIAYVQVFLAERDLAERDLAVAALSHGVGTTPAVHQFWIRGSVVNEQYVAGHWGIASASAPGPAVVSPGPLPHLLNITTIQGQDWANPPYNTSASNWSSQLVGGKTFDGDSHPLEWVSVLNPTLEQDDEVGVAGFALAAEISQNDLPFTHPFGYDFEFCIVPDAAYTNLLAPSNRPPANANTDSEVSEAFSQVRGLGLPAIGAFAMEVEAGMVPEPYRAVLGDRVAMYGRWIVDAGHNDFHCEIHPPLLLARAQAVNAQGAQVYPDASAITLMQLWGRPFQAAQKFTTGSSKNLTLKDYVTKIGIETLGDIVAYPPVFPKPFDGIHLVSFVVRPPVQAPPPAVSAVLGPAHLECSYSFTTNKSCGVQVQQSLSDPNAVEVILALNSAGYPTLPEPPFTKVAWSIDKLRSDIPGDSGLTAFIIDAVSAYQSIAHGGNLYVRTYNPLPAPDVTTHAVPFTPLGTLPRSQVNVDDTQPFPIVGWLKLMWVRSSIVVSGGLHQAEAAKS